jgi:hypothetical protein
VILMSDQWYSEIATSTDESPPHNALDKSTYFVRFVALATVIISVWVVVATLAWPSKHTNPYWNGQASSEYYKLNDFLEPAGIDLGRDFPLGFGTGDSLENTETSLSLLDTNGKTVRLNLQWHGKGYVLDVPASVVAIRLQTTNTAHIDVEEVVINGEPREYTAAIHRRKTLANFFSSTTGASKKSRYLSQPR